MRRRRQRNVTLAGQQARGGVEADPAGAGYVDFRPGVQVREVDGRAGRPVQRGDVGLQLDEVAGDEAGGEPELAGYLHQQPGAVATGAGGQGQGLLGGLHARIHPHEVADLALQPSVQLDQEVHRARRRGGETVDIGLQGRAIVLDLEVGRELSRQLRRIGERHGLGIGLDEEVERIDHRHLGGEVHLDAELADRLGKHQPRQPVSERILLPVDEVRRGRDLQGVAGNPRSRVRRRPKADGLGTQRHRPVVAIESPVMQRDSDRHRLSEALARRQHA